MDKTYKKFSHSNINLAPVGIEQRPDNPLYFCTPKGASVFGWAGTDGIHFCFIRGFGEMVFSVNPMNTPQNHVHPLAKNFADFLRLILACGDASALEQTWMWDEPQFDAFLLKNPPTQEQKRILTELSEKMKLTPMEQPWAYMKALQSDFDYSKIKYTEDYYDIDMNPSAEAPIPEWKVYFNGNFWGHHGRDHAGREIRIDKEFHWAGHRWIIPSAYICGKGIVIDFCMQVEPKRIRRFMEKWNLSLENDSCENFTREEQMQMELENPLCLNFTPRLKVNRKILQASHGCSVCFNPCLPGKNFHDSAVSHVLKHYGLDESCGWIVYRNAFLWGSRRCPEIKSLSLTMEQQLQELPGPYFTAGSSGDTFLFFNPVSGIIHTLTVQEIEQQTIPSDRFSSERWTYPAHCTVMNYTLSPEPAYRITISDCDEGDKPVEAVPDEDPFRPAASNGCAVAVIGGAAGPVAMSAGTETHEKLHTACSSLHFHPVLGPVEWRITFHTREFEEKSFSLIEKGR